jgi:hypothetical protein
LPRDEMGRIIRPAAFNPRLPVSAQGIAPPTTNLPSPIEEFDAPDDLTAEERAVWLKQAPHAFRARTLTPGTALAFERYCKVVVLERHEAKSSGVSGSNHRGLLKQINAYELQFMLTPCGKPLIEAAAPKQDEDDAFFGGGRAGSRSA